MRLLKILSTASVLTTAYAGNTTVSTTESSTTVLLDTTILQDSSALAVTGSAVNNNSSHVGATGRKSATETHSDDPGPLSSIRSGGTRTSTDLGFTSSSPGRNSTIVSSRSQSRASITGTPHIPKDVSTSSRFMTSEIDEHSGSSSVIVTTSGSHLQSSTSSTSNGTSPSLLAATSQSTNSLPTSNGSTVESLPDTDSSGPGSDSLTSSRVDSLSGTTVTMSVPGEMASFPHPALGNLTTSASSSTFQPGQTVTSDQPLSTSSSHTESSATSKSFLPIGALITGTSTVTSLPSSVTFESIPAFTGNAWTTTTGDQSSSTVVPIIGGVMIWHMPTSGPGIVFNLPDFPKFQLPSCIIGDCPESPKVGKDDGKKKENDENDNNDTDGDDNDEDDDDTDGEQEEDEDQDQRSTSSSETSDSETSSSTSTCSGGETTVSDCRVACSTSYSWADETITGTQRCYITSCQQTVGCSIEPTTTTSTSSLPFACTGNGQLEQYDPVATLSSLGLEVPLWMQFALSYDSIIAEETSESMAEDASATDTSATTVSTTTSDRVITTSASVESTSFDSTSSLGSVTTQSSTSSSTTLDESDTQTSSKSASTAAITSPSSSFATSSPIETAIMTISEVTEPTPVCHDESDFPDHPPVDAALVDRGAEFFCRVRRQWYPGYEGVTNMTSDSATEEVTYQEVNSRVNYSYELVWKDGDACEYITDVQQIDKPIGGEAWDCRTLFTTAYSGCNNGGVGGYLDAGCLRYTFTGGQDDGDVEFSPMPAGVQVKIADLG